MASKVQAAASPQPLRAPSQDIRGNIIEMLVLCYDRKTKRYKGADTDKSIADAIGDGCMPGWVAEIRERDFGPSGENDEMADLAAYLAAIRDEFTVAIQKLTKETEGKIALAQSRIDTLRAAVGPKAGR